MNPIKSLMGRRQFLIATGVASTCALTCKKLAGFQANAAMAADKAARKGMKAAANQYPHLLSPFRIRNVVLKNRIMHTTSPPHSLQGAGKFPHRCLSKPLLEYGQERRHCFAFHGLWDISEDL